MNRLATSPASPSLAIRARPLCGLWLITLTLSVLYCWLWEFAHGRQIGDLEMTLRWAFATWSGWILMSFLFALRNPLAAVLDRIWKHRLGWVLFLIAAPLIAVAIEWNILRLFTAMGMAVFKRDNFWLLVWDRGPLCIVGSTALALGIWIARYLTQTSPQPTAVAVPDHVAPANETSFVENASPPEPTLNVTTPRGVLTIPAHEIEALISAENYVEVCLATGAHYLQRATLQGIGATLTTPSMIRIRRSAIINVDHITSRLSGGRLRLKSGRIVTIGRTYRADVEALLNIPRPVTTIAPVTPSVPVSPSAYRAPVGSDRAREQRVQ